MHGVRRRDLPARRSSVPDGRRVPSRDQRGQVPTGAAGHEAASRRGRHTGQIGDPSEGFVLGPDRAGPLEPAASVDGGRGQGEVEEHAGSAGSSGHERQEGGVVRRDRGGGQHVRPDAQRLGAADPTGGDRVAGRGAELLGGGGTVERRRGGDPVPDVILDRPGQRLGLLRVPVHLLHRRPPWGSARDAGPALEAGPARGTVEPSGACRYPASSPQNSPNASTYVRMSSSECWTEIVHCSSSPGVMKIPRLIIHEKLA